MGRTHSSWHNNGTSELMAHPVHTARGIMRQDTEGEHHGGTQLLFSSMPQTGMQTLKIAHEELPDCYITTRKSPKLAHCSENYFWWRRSTTESKQNEPSLLPLCSCSADILSQRAHNSLDLCCVILCRNKQEIL